MSTDMGLLHSGKQMLRTICPQFVLNWREEQYYAKFGEVELHIVEFLNRPEQDAVDVGAHDGCYIHTLRHHAQTVHAFEPLPWLAKALRRKFAGAYDVEIQDIALSDHAGSAVLHIPIVNGAAVIGCSTISEEALMVYGASQDLVVSLERLDALALGQIGFIKIDVEGHEESVLDGATATIKTNRPRVLVELVDRLAPGCTGRVIQRFDDLGYEGFFIYHGELFPIDRFDLPTHQNEANAPDLVATLETRERFGDYVYNFIFVPQEDVAAISSKIRHRLKTLA